MNFLSRILIIGAVQDSLINFRGDLLKTLVKTGHEVIALALKGSPEITELLNRIGVCFIPYPVQRNGLNPIADIQTVLALRNHFYHLQPDIVLSYTIKPVIWSGIALFGMSRPKYFPMITGLGYAFHGTGLLRKLLALMVSNLYRISLKHASGVIFQNTDNYKHFISRNIIPREIGKIVSGSGVNLERFLFTPLPKSGTVFLFVGRLLKEKGLREFVQAAQTVKRQYPEVEFHILGPEDPSPDAISRQEIQDWQNKGVVKYLGVTSDVRPFLSACHIFVLPSYHEGMPRTIQEAMAIGRPILTTNVPGCRETVIPGTNGYLVPSANAEALAKQMLWFIENRSVWQRMGEQSRFLAERRFDVHAINSELLKIMGLLS